MTLDGVMTLCGYVCVLITLGAIPAVISHRREERLQASWPQATAIVQRCDVERVYWRIRNSGGPVWHIQCSGRISVDGKSVRVSFRSHSVGRAAEIQELRTWAAQHDEGASVAVRYDPGRPRTVVPEPSSMPHAESQIPGEEEVGVVFAVAGVLLLSGGARLRRRAATGSDVAGPHPASA